MEMACLPSCFFRGCPGDWGVLREKEALGCAPRRHRHWLRAIELGRDQYLALATPTALNTLLWLPRSQSPSPVRAFLHQRAGVLSRLRAPGLRPEGSWVCRQVFFSSSTGAPSAFASFGSLQPSALHAAHLPACWHAQKVPRYWFSTIPLGSGRQALGVTWTKEHISLSLCPLHKPGSK